MIPGAFDYHRPSSVDQAVNILNEHNGDALVVAGGHSLIPMMKLRMALPAHLVDLQAIDELKQIHLEGSTVHLGAMVTQAQLIESSSLRAACPILAETALLIADPQVRNMGTLGGNVANGDPGNDMPALMQALNARYHLQGASGEREVVAREFYQGPYMTARQDGEVLTHITFNAPSKGHGWAYLKQKRKIGDYATAATAVLLEKDGARIRRAAIGFSNLADTPIWADAASQQLTDLSDDTISKVVAAATALCDPAADGRRLSRFSHEGCGRVARAGHSNGGPARLLKRPACVFSRRRGMPLAKARSRHNRAKQR